MPQPTDHPDGSRTLPESESNPLLNPLLRENVRQWATAYFMSPPETREQAVQALLSETEAGESECEDSPPASFNSVLDPMVSPVSLPSHDRPPQVRCSYCGRENPESYTFCGICGTRLGGEADAPARRREDSSEDDFPFFRIYRNRPYGDDYDSASSASRSYRAYIAIGVAVVIFALGYMARRSTWVSQNSRTTPSATPQVTSQAPALAPSTATTSDAGNLSAPSSTGSAVSPFPAAGANPVSQNPVTQNPIHNMAGAQAQDANLSHRARRGPDAPHEESPSSAGGSQEFAIAQSYLDGANGQTRNSAEAAKWLWKATAKHNADATLLLSDLYLKGNGVPKNCDQARVLLDAAAIEGVKGAGERLRHLPAFGCQ